MPPDDYDNLYHICFPEGHTKETRLPADCEEVPMSKANRITAATGSAKNPDRGLIGAGVGGDPDSTAQDVLKDEARDGGAEG